MRRWTIFCRGQLERDLYPRIRSATSCYRLPDLGEERKHEVGWILGEFVEFVAFDRTAGSLALIVACED